MKKALVVGINNYPSAPLRGCVRDATDLAHILETNSDHTANFDVLLETNVARRHTLRRLITELFKGSNEIALFYFSGHGYFDGQGGYLVTPDHCDYDEGIPMSELMALANESRAKNRIIILDCCHSGAITAPALSHATTGHINEGVTILTASRQDETSVEVNGMGIFTNLLLEALKGGAADLGGRITPGSVYAYIDQALGAWDQRPVFKTNVSSFVSLRHAAPLLPVKTLKKINTYFKDADALFPLDASYEYTNDPALEPACQAPYAQAAHVSIFKALQQMQRAGLVEPVGEEHMYWAAMNGKSCRLTPLGKHYQRLVRDKRI